MFEYSNGYSTADSRTESGSVEHYGSFDNSKQANKINSAIDRAAALRQNAVATMDKALGRGVYASQAQQVVPGIAVINFGEETTDPLNLGVNIRLGYNDPKKRYSEYRWIQTVRTNSLNATAKGKSPFNDSPGNGTPYWEEHEMGTWTNVDGFSTMFFDSPGRSKDSQSFFWRAELTIGGMKDGVFVPLGTMTYGFDINNGKVTITPLQVSQPTPWHVDSVTNKSKW
jgi:hypothetical protein